MRRIKPLFLVKKDLEKYEIPSYIKQKFFYEKAPHLTKAEVDLVFENLKCYLYLSYIKPTYLSSYIIDEAWHTFLLFTKEYKEFCTFVFWKFMHHAPSISGGYVNDIELIKQSYYHMLKHKKNCKLFTLDSELNIKGSTTKGIINLEFENSEIKVLLNKKVIGSFNAPKGEEN